MPYLAIEMMLFRGLALCLFCLFSQNSFATSDLISVAVADFKSNGAVEFQWIGGSCAESIVGKVSKDRMVRVVERENLDRILNELKLQASGIVDEQTAVEIGRLVGVNFFVFGSVSVMGKQAQLRARVVNVQTAEITGTADIRGDLDDLFDLQEKLSVKVSEELAVTGALTQAENAVDLGKINFSALSKLDRLKKLTTSIPFFQLDPARARKTGEYSLAIGICEELINSYPNLYLAHYYRSLLLLQLNDTEGAELAARISRQLSPNTPEVHLLRATILMVQRKEAEANTVLRFFVSKYPEDARGWFGLSRLEVRSNKVGAIEALITATRFLPSLPQAAVNLRTLLVNEELSTIQFSSENFRDAAILYQRFFDETERGTYNEEAALRLQKAWPEFYLGYYALGFNALVSGQSQKAYSQLQLALKRNPELGQIHREMAVYFLRAGDCGRGKQHATLFYQRTMAVGADFSKLEKLVNNCTE